MIAYTPHSYLTDRELICLVQMQKSHTDFEMELMYRLHKRVIKREKKKLKKDLK